jgi:hypothetical protein
MTRRLATLCFMAILTAGAHAPAVHAQNDNPGNATLKGIDAIYVVVEELPDGAKALGLTKEATQTDVELKLRLAGMRVVTKSEWFRLPGNPYLYVTINMTKGATAAAIAVALNQNVLLERNSAAASGATTWSKEGVLSNPDAQFVRDRTKDLVDEFLNAWLSVNPK